MPYGDYNRQREIFPVTPFLFLQVRGNYTEWSSNSCFVWTVAAVNTSDFRYKTGESKIFILTSGYYEIVYEMSVYLYSGAMAGMHVDIYHNGNIMPGSRAYAHFTNSYLEDMSGHYYSYFNAGDYIQLHSTVGAGGGTLRTAEHTVRLVIKFMAAKGWNNSSGGNANFRGGVMR